VSHFRPYLDRFLNSPSGDRNKAEEICARPTSSINVYSGESTPSLMPQAIDRGGHHAKPFLSSWRDGSSIISLLFSVSNLDPPHVLASATHRRHTIIDKTSTEPVPTLPQVRLCSIRAYDFPSNPSTLDLNQCSYQSRNVYTLSRSSPGSPSPA
jgi:hypothetical protein